MDSDSTGRNSSTLSQAVNCTSDGFKEEGNSTQSSTALHVEAKLGSNNLGKSVDRDLSSESPFTLNDTLRGLEENNSKKNYEDTEAPCFDSTGTVDFTIIGTEGEQNNISEKSNQNINSPIPDQVRTVDSVSIHNVGFEKNISEKSSENVDVPCSDNIDTADSMNTDTEGNEENISKKVNEDIDAHCCDSVGTVDCSNLNAVGKEKNRAEKSAEDLDAACSDSAGTVNSKDIGTEGKVTLQQHNTVENGKNNDVEDDTEIANPSHVSDLMCSPKEKKIVFESTENEAINVSLPECSDFEKACVGPVECASVVNNNPENVDTGSSQSPENITDTMKGQDIYNDNLESSPQVVSNTESDGEQIVCEPALAIMNSDSLSTVNSIDGDTVTSKTTLTSEGEASNDELKTGHLNDEEGSIESIVHSDTENVKGIAQNGLQSTNSLHDGSPCQASDSIMPEPLNKSITNSEQITEECASIQISNVKSGIPYDSDEECESKEPQNEDSYDESDSLSDTSEEGEETEEVGFLKKCNTTNKNLTNVKVNSRHTSRTKISRSVSGKERVKESKSGEEGFNKLKNKQNSKDIRDNSEKGDSEVGQREATEFVQVDLGPSENTPRDIEQNQGDFVDLSVVQEEDPIKSDNVPNVQMAQLDAGECHKVLIRSEGDDPVRIVDAIKLAQNQECLATDAKQNSRNVSPAPDNQPSPGSELEEKQECSKSTNEGNVDIKDKFSLDVRNEEQLQNDDTGSKEKNLKEGLSVCVSAKDCDTTPSSIPQSVKDVGLVQHGVGRIIVSALAQNNFNAKENAQQEICLRNLLECGKEKPDTADKKSSRPQRRAAKKAETQIKQVMQVMAEQDSNSNEETENTSSDEITQQMCYQCCRMRVCKLQMMVKGISQNFCTEECLERFKTQNNEVASKEGVADDTTCDVRKCSQCQAVVIGEEKNLSWETMDFCNEECLAAYQRQFGSFCTTCKGTVQSSSLGKYCVRFGFDIRQFCCSDCLEDFKKGLKVCSYCQKDISAGYEGFLAPVGDKGQFKDFCSQECMSKYDAMSNRGFHSTEIARCAVCNNEQVVKVEVIFTGTVNKLCSEPCFAAFKFVNGIVSGRCDMCKRYFDRSDSDRMIVYYDDVPHSFCCKTCMNVYILAHRKIVPCYWCKVKKYNFDMIKRVTAGGTSVLVCSLNCLTMYQYSQNTVTSKRLTCDNCGVLSRAQYHLTMSDESVRNFCGYSCVMKFQEKYKQPPIELTGIHNPVPTVPTPTGLPIISSVTSLAVQGGSNSLVIGTSLPSTPICTTELPAVTNIVGANLPVAANLPTGANISANVALPVNTNLPAGSSLPSTANLSVSKSIQTGKNISGSVNLPVATNLSVVGNLPGTGNLSVVATLPVAASNNLPVTPRNLIPVRPAVRYSKKNGQSTPPPSKVVVKELTLVHPQEHPEMMNAIVQTKPIVNNKAVFCRPHLHPKETQTDESMGKSVLVPIPVPVYVPCPMNMYSLPFAIPVPFPLPIPVPVFIPTTKKSASGIMKDIQRIREKLPDDPYEAELLMMAEMVAGESEIGAGERKEETSDSEEDDGRNSSTASGRHSAAIGEAASFTPEAVDTSNTFGEDMLQMALKMASEFEEPAVDVENALSAATITPAVDDSVETADGDDVEDDTEWSPATRVSKKRPLRSAAKAVPLKRCRRTEGTASATASTEEQTEPEPEQEPEPKTKSGVNMHLKSILGVNAWQKFIARKNAELEKLGLNGGKVKLFKTEILQLSADELNFSLCQFVKEVRKPNGEEYAPDTLLYLCLGIQHYLLENGRMDNIFTDTYYEAFTDCLDEVTRKFSTLFCDTSIIVTRVEEEHLWESKQLGAHSPHVLLSTLIFFNTKYFKLLTVEEHVQLSFSHIMKHWKRTPGQERGTKANVPRSVLLRFYPPVAPEDIVANKRRKSYEQHENKENPLRCPVKLYEFYLSKCPESVKSRNDVFYLMPERSCVPDSPVWYSTMSLGEKQLSKMLNRLRTVKEINEAVFKRGEE